MMSKQLDLIGEWFGAWRTWDRVCALEQYPPGVISAGLDIADRFPENQHFCSSHVRRQRITAANSSIKQEITAQKCLSYCKDA